MFFVSCCSLSKRGPEGVPSPLEDLPSPRAAPALPPPVSEQSEYILGPEDVIDVVVWKDLDLTRSVLIRPDGKISLPLIGEVQVAGSTPAEVSGIVKHRLQKYYKEPPEVSVVVTGVNHFAVFILGEVVVPGKQVLHKETRLLQALSLAGGFKEFADTNKILLLRKEGQTEKRIHIRYKDIINGKHPEKNYWLKPGDTIVIP